MLCEIPRLLGRGDQLEHAGTSERIIIKQYDGQMTTSIESQRATQNLSHAPLRRIAAALLCTLAACSQLPRPAQDGAPPAPAGQSGSVPSQPPASPMSAPVPDEASRSALPDGGPMLTIDSAK